MSNELNEILIYLKANKKRGFYKKTKFILKERIAQHSILESCLTKLSSDGYIRSYFHPRMGLHDNLMIDSDLKIFYSLSRKGLEFINKGGYQIK